MSRETVFHILITGIMLAILLLLGVLPTGADPYAYLFQPVLLMAVLSGILSGTVYAAAVGILAPLFAMLLFRRLPFMPDTLTLMISYGIAGVVSGVFYSLFRTSIGAAVGGVLAWLGGYGVTRILVHLSMGESYFFTNYLNETFVRAWPGLVLTLVLVPLITVLLRNKGAMWVLRHERDD